MNFSKLDSFIHVSGKYYDRRAFSFLAKQAAFTGPSGVNIPARDQLLVYPNPSPGLIYLDLSPYTGNVLIKVHDLKGNVLYEKVTNDKLTTIDLSGYSQAMYVFTLIEGNRVVKKPVLIIK